MNTPSYNAIQFYISCNLSFNSKREYLKHTLKSEHIKETEYDLKKLSPRLSLMLRLKLKLESKLLFKLKLKLKKTKIKLKLTLILILTQKTVLHIQENIFV